MITMTTKAYVYKWTHLPTLMWYVGSRTKIGCHPDDGYKGSSNYATPLINANPEEWSKEIIATGEPQEMYDLETEILQLFDAKNDPRSYNYHNNDNAINGLCNKGRKATDEAKKNISMALKGRVKSPEHQAKITAKQKEKIVSEETKEKIRLARAKQVMRPFTDADKKKRADKMRGRKYAPESIEKMRVSHRGHIASQETKDKMAASQRARWEIIRANREH